MEFSKEYLSRFKTIPTDDQLRQSLKKQFPKIEIAKDHVEALKSAIAENCALSAPLISDADFDLSGVRKGSGKQSAGLQILIDAMKSSHGVDAKSARMMIFKSSDDDPEGRLTRKAIRLAQTTARQQGFKTVRLRSGISKTYFVVTQEKLASLEIAARNAGLTFELVTAQTSV